MPATQTTAAAKKPARRPTTTTAAARSSTRTQTPRHRRPSHGEISDRAYFIALEEGGADDVHNWLRAERELAAG